MLKPHVIGLAVGVSLIASFPAQAATVTLYGAFGSSLVGTDLATDQAAGRVATFDTIIPNPAHPATSPSQPAFNDGGISFGTGAIIRQNPPGDSSGNYAAPFGDNTQYAAVLTQNGGSLAATFGGDYTRLGLFWGSVDSYNSIQFYNNGSLVDTVLGTAVNPADGNQTAPATNRYVLITGIAGGFFDEVRFNTTQNAFEFDNLSFGRPDGVDGQVPLPLTLPLFAAGLGVVGLMSRRRKRSA